MKNTSIIDTKETLIPTDYSSWKDGIIEQIHSRQLRTVLNVNADTLQNYWEVGRQILQAQEEKGWGKQVVELLSKDLEAEFGAGQGYSVRNLRYMKAFSQEYPDFPIWKVPLAELQSDAEKLQVPLAELPVQDEKVQVPLAEITWYHHISLLSKVKDARERAFYITETARNGWSRDVMLMQVGEGCFQGPV